MYQQAYSVQGRQNVWVADQPTAISMLTKLPRSRTKFDTREKQLAWLLELMQITGKTATSLAVEAGLSDTTLTRFMNKPDYTGTLGNLTLATLSEFYGHPLPGFTPNAPAPSAPKSEATVYDFENDKVHGGTIRQMIAGRREASCWRMNTPVLSLAGVREGDIMIVDQAATPAAGEVICLQVEGGNHGATTLFRVLDAPFAVAACMPIGGIKPLLINGETVRIAGVMTELLRARAA